MIVKRALNHRALVLLGATRVEDVRRGGNVVAVEISPDDLDLSGYEAALEKSQKPPLAEVSRRQLRLALLSHGHLTRVEKWLFSLEEPKRSEAHIEWQDAAAYRADHWLIEMLFAELGLSPTESSALWREAMER